MLRIEQVGRITAVLAAMWGALCLFWESTDKFYRGQFWPWLLVGVAIIALATLGVTWALQNANRQVKDEQPGD